MEGGEGKARVCQGDFCCLARWQQVRSRKYFWSSQSIFLTRLPLAEERHWRILPWGFQRRALGGWERARHVVDADVLRHQVRLSMMTKMMTMLVITRLVEMQNSHSFLWEAFTQSQVRRGLSSRLQPEPKLGPGLPHQLRHHLHQPHHRSHICRGRKSLSWGFLTNSQNNFSQNLTVHSYDNHGRSCGRMPSFLVRG